MKIRLKKVGDGLFPLTPQDADALEKIKGGDVLETSLRRVRNPRFHRKFFALLSVVLANQELYETTEDFLTELKIRTGWYEPLIIDGKVVYVPLSISFEKMDEIEFAMFYQKSIDAILKMLPGFTKHDIDNLASEVISFS